MRVNDLGRDETKRSEEQGEGRGNDVGGVSLLWRKKCSIRQVCTLAAFALPHLLGRGLSDALSIAFFDGRPVVPVPLRENVVARNIVLLNSRNGARLNEPLNTGGFIHRR